MKTRTETVVVPEETYTKTTFGCDFCDFETDDEEQMKAHHGKTHASKKTVEIGGTTFHWFDSKEDAELFLDPPGEYSAVDSTEVRWSEPGWYGSDSEMHRGGCRCGGCERIYAYLRPMSDFIERWQTDITNHEKAVAARLSHIEAAQKLNPNPEGEPS